MGLGRVLCLGNQDNAKNVIILNPDGLNGREVEVSVHSFGTVRVTDEAGRPIACMRISKGERVKVVAVNGGLDDVFTAIRGGD